MQYLKVALEIYCNAYSQWLHHNIFVGGIEGAKCISEMEKIQNICRKLLIFVILSL